MFLRIIAKKELSSKQIDNYRLLAPLYRQLTSCSGILRLVDTMEEKTLLYFIYEPNEISKIFFPRINAAGDEIGGGIVTFNAFMASRESGNKSQLYFVKDFLRRLFEAVQ